MLSWATGPYMEAFETDNVTVAVVCLDSNRVGQLIDWTMRELTARSTQELCRALPVYVDSPVENPQSASFSITCGIRPTQGKLFRSWIFRCAHE